MKVAIVTPTIGSNHLKNCVDSVANQTYKNITHYVFADGIEHFVKVRSFTDNQVGVKLIELEENVGKGWYGHRVYSACSFLVNADIICYLDEDNWIEPDHVENLVKKLEEGYDWVYSLRKIYDKDGKYLCDDNCESLGKWPTFFNDQVFHIDTGSFAIRRDIAVRIGHAWYGQWGADRQFFNAIKQYYPNFDCTGKHTLCYRLDGNPNSVKYEFFEEGNKIQKQKYGESYPWHNTDKKVQVAPGISIIV